MLKWINKKRNNKGFTLVELIVVIAILGIIGAIAVPRFTNLQNSSKVKADAATAQEIVNAARIQEVDTGKKVTGLPAAAATTIEEGQLNPNYMTVPEPQSAPGGTFTLLHAATTDGGQYTVIWTPTDAGVYNTKEQTVTEGKVFKISE